MDNVKSLLYNKLNQLNDEIKLLNNELISLGNKVDSLCNDIDQKELLRNEVSDLLIIMENRDK